MLADFFHEQPRAFLQPEPDPAGRGIIEFCLNNVRVEDCEQPMEAAP
jgi:hypothetical protein